MTVAPGETNGIVADELGFGYGGAGRRRADQPQRVRMLSRSATRIEVIVTFLAVLELVKLREIEVVQDDTFGEIELVPVAAGETGAAQDGAQESAQESAEG